MHEIAAAKPVVEVYACARAVEEDIVADHGLGCEGLEVRRRLLAKDARLVHQVVRNECAPVKRAIIARQKRRGGLLPSGER